MLCIKYKIHKTIELGCIRYSVYLSFRLFLAPVFRIFIWRFVCHWFRTRMKKKKWKQTRKTTYKRFAYRKLSIKPNADAFILEKYLIRWTMGWLPFDLFLTCSLVGNTFHTSIHLMSQTVNRRKMGKQKIEEYDIECTGHRAIQFFSFFY